MISEPFWREWEDISPRNPGLTGQQGRRLFCLSLGIGTPSKSHCVVFVAMGLSLDAVTTG